VLTAVCASRIQPQYQRCVHPYSPGVCVPPTLQQVDDPAVMVSFPIVGDAEGASLVAWTTTPWTLPSNLALCVNPEFVYVKVSGVRGKSTGKGCSLDKPWVQS
jgi:isoleucyl-tRNA synthetase